MPIVFVGALMIVDSEAPSTTLRSLRESRVVPLPRFAGAERSSHSAAFVDALA